MNCTVFCLIDRPTPVIYLVPFLPSFLPHCLVSCVQFQCESKSHMEAMSNKLNNESRKQASKKARNCTYVPGTVPAYWSVPLQYRDTQNKLYDTCTPACGIGKRGSTASPLLTQQNKQKNTLNTF